MIVDPSKICLGTSLLFQGTASYDPRYGGFAHCRNRSARLKMRGKNRFVFSDGGLRCRRLGKGVYRFAFSNGGLPDIVSCMIEIASPWCEQMVKGMIQICEFHGSLGQCPPDGEDCQITSRIIDMNRWYAFGRLGTGKDGRCFDVCLLRKPPLRKGALKDPPAVPVDGAGFHIMVLSK